VEPESLDAVRALVPPDGSWALWDGVLDVAIARGLSRRVTRAALAHLACSELEAKTRGARLWVRRRAAAQGAA
jgi:hypothetical protein